MVGSLSIKDVVPVREIGVLVYLCQYFAWLHVMCDSVIQCDGLVAECHLVFTFTSHYTRLSLCSDWAGFR